jgi:predicted alpha-1,2-mannosidase
MYIFLFIIFIFSTALSQTKPVDYVNPFIGTINSGNTFPGAVVPWGMVSVSPHNSPGTPPGYMNGKDDFYGFGHTHLSGTGCAELGSIIVTASRGDINDDAEEYKMKFSREVADPGYYSLYLDEINTRAEVTASVRSGLIKFISGSDGEFNLMFDLGKSLALLGGGSVNIISETELEGSNISGGFCGEANRQTVYFAARLSAPAKESGIISSGRNIHNRSYQVTDSTLVTWFKYNLNKGDSLMIKTGLSYTSTENAWNNLNNEIPGWDFESVRRAANDQWNEALSRVMVEGENDSDKVKFYSALYHMYIHPNIISDISGDYPLMGRNGIGNYKDRQRYTVYSLWDTYRTLHPFMTLVYPELQSDFVKTMIDMYKENGFLPKWELIANETYMMVGDPAVPVIADSYIKGITDFDAETALEAMLKTTMLREGEEAPPVRAGYHELLEYKYIPFEQDKSKDWWVWGPVSTSLEYNFADWSIAQLAGKLGKMNIHDEYLERSMYYKNLFDESTLFFRPRMQNGDWLTPFDSLAYEGSGDWQWSGGPGYVEGNAWTYAWFVPHDTEGLKELYGGEDIFYQRLKKFFDDKHFTIGNEPDIHYPYLFRDVKGKEHLTPEIVHDIMNTRFSTGADGLPGDDDCGTISAWFVFSAMGFYPACPASEEYVAGYPLFDRITIKLNGNYYGSDILIIERENGGSGEILLDDKIINNYKINHHELTKSRSLKFR